MNAKEAGTHLARLIDAVEATGNQRPECVAANREALASLEALPPGLREALEGLLWAIESESGRDLAPVQHSPMVLAAIAALKSALSTEPCTWQDGSGAVCGRKDSHAHLIPRGQGCDQRTVDG